MKKINKNLLLLLIVLIIISGCGKIQNPKLNLKPGLYNQEIEVSFENYKDYAAILYTTNGKVPNQNMVVAAVTSDGTLRYNGEKIKVKFYEKMAIKYIAFKRGKSPSKVQTLEYSVLPKCKSPKIEVNQNIVFMSAGVGERIYYSLNNSKYEEGNCFFLQPGINKIKIYTKRAAYQDSDVIEKKITIAETQMVKTDIKPPFVNMLNDKLTINSMDEAYYSINGEQYKKYVAPVQLSDGNYTVEAYSVRRILKDKSIESKRIVNNYTVEKKYDIPKYENTYSSASIKEVSQEPKVVEPPKGVLVQTKIQVASYANIYNCNGYSFVVDKAQMLKIKDKVLEKKLTFDNEINDVCFSNNSIYVLLGNEVVKINYNLEKQDSITNNDAYDKLVVDDRNYYYSNTNTIQIVNKKTLNKEKIDISKYKVTKITGITNNFIIGEKRGDYNNVIPFMYFYKQNKYMEMANSINEYCIGFSQKNVYTIIDRDTINFYDLNKKVKSKKIGKSIIINNLVVFGNEVIFLGNVLDSDEMIIISLKNNNMRVHTEKSIVPLNVKKSGNKYIVEGSKNNNYCQVIINGYILN